MYVSEGVCNIIFVAVYKTLARNSGSNIEGRYKQRMWRNSGSCWGCEANHGVSDPPA